MTESQNHDQRRFTRVPFDAKVIVTLDEANLVLEGHLLDVSFKGLMVETAQADTAKTGTTGTARVVLSKGTVEFDLSITVKHLEQTHVGLQVDQMPIEAAEHLRALMLHNLGDEALLQRELHALVSQGS